MHYLSFIHVDSGKSGIITTSQRVTSLAGHEQHWVRVENSENSRVGSSENSDHFWLDTEKKLRYYKFCNRNTIFFRT